MAWIVALVLTAVPASAGANWPQFRGPGGDGHADAAALPLTWSETEHVKWKTAIHDRGWSSPVILDKQVWLTTATKSGKELFAVCVDADSGKIIHDIKVFEVEKPDRIAAINSYASPTPAIEAGRVYVHYGTYGTACLDTATGKTLWARRDLNCDHHEGPGASPILFGDLLIFHVDGTNVQYAVALDKATGKTAWKTNRSADLTKVHPFTRKAYGTPIVIESGGRLQLISPASRAVFAYDPRTGEELWKLPWRGWSVTPRPLFGHGLLFLIIDYENPELWAVRPGGQGELPKDSVVWKIPKGMPQKPSLLLIGDLLYLVHDQGMAACIEAKTGQIVWQQKLPGEYSASPIYAAGRIYFFSHNCVATVIEPGRQFKSLATNKLDGRMMASPAVAANALFLRTETHLYRIEE
ncbi:MAG: quinonprotein alcohol dehydrogenase [Planctomycetes bacterium]|nr:quinonprotein alcohol dehydrogenase [Planctomycetota bacterium]